MKAQQQWELWSIPNNSSPTQASPSCLVDLAQKRRVKLN